MSLTSVMDFTPIRATRTAAAHPDSVPPTMRRSVERDWGWA
jgi:hypothetical protein